MRKTFSDNNQTVKKFNSNVFSRSKSTTSVPVFKYLCNSIPELLNVFEDPAQRVHTIALLKMYQMNNYVCFVPTLTMQQG